MWHVIGQKKIVMPITLDYAFRRWQENCLSKNRSLIRNLRSKNDKNTCLHVHMKLKLTEH